MENKNKKVNQASAATHLAASAGGATSLAQVRRYLCRLWGHILENYKLAQQSLEALEQRMIAIENVVSKARNIHNMMKNNHIAAMSHLSKLIKNRQKKEAKAVF